MEISSHIRHTKGQTLAFLAMALVAAGCGASEESEPAATTRERPAASVARESEGCVSRAAFETDEPIDAGPSWSPDGRRIAFHTNRSGADEVWTIDPSTCATKRVTAGTEPDWSPDGSQLVFMRFRQYVGDDGLWTSNAHGLDVRRVTAARALDAFPAWSPRGTPIAFDRDAGIEEQDRRELHLVHPDGKRLHKLTRRTWTITPAFSPDGAWIAYADSVRIWRMRLDGTRRQPLTTGSANGDSDPSFSPDGRFLVFSRSTAERGLEPWILDLRSGSERPLVQVPGNAPDWSPDGKWIVFVRYGEEGAEHLALVRPDGTGLRKLTEPAAR